MDQNKGFLPVLYSKVFEEDHAVFCPFTHSLTYTQTQPGLYTCTYCMGVGLDVGDSVGVGDGVGDGIGVGDSDGVGVCGCDGVGGCVVVLLLVWLLMRLLVLFLA